MQVEDAATFYLQAKEWIRSSEFHAELQEYSGNDVTSISESQFLREHAWVVLNSGFREAIIRDRFDFISLCFCDWESAASIAKAGLACVYSARAVFRNDRKLLAILRASELVAAKGIHFWLSGVQCEPIQTLRVLPYIGEVTAFHLAKNLGLNVVKPDRHLTRLARRFGYVSVEQMCTDVARATGDQEKVIDSVLWRFQEQTYARKNKGSMLTQKCQYRRRSS